MVSRMPSIFSFGLICRRTFCTVCKSCSRPFADRYCACTGIRVVSAAASALTVSIPREGVQSSRMKSYSCFAPVQHLFEHLFPVHAVDKGNFQPCQFDVCRNQVNALCMVQDAFTGWNALVVHGFCHQGGKGGGQFIGLLPAHADGQAALRVSVHQQDFLPSIASPMPRFSQVVVLPVPPFWLTMAIVVAFFEIFITPASLSRGWFGSGRKAASWWVRCTEKRAGIVSCFGSGCCSLQGTSAQSGYGRRSAS